jgi:hypothetical protein
MDRPATMQSAERDEEKPVNGPSLLANAGVAS